MKIINLISSLFPGDAVGNYVLELNKIFREHKEINSEIFAVNLDPELKHYSKTVSINNFNVKNLDILTYQFATSDIGLKNIFINTSAKKKIIFYHNITPSKFFKGYDDNCVSTQIQARKELKELAKHTDLAIAMSDYSANELTEYGFKKVITIPFIADFKKYNISKDLDLELKARKGKKIIFISRVVPHKGHKDLIKTFYLYSKLFDKDASMYIVGGCPFSNYELELKKMISDFSLEDRVILTGKISGDKLGAYFNNANLFFSMSEHEGFFVPLIECMHFNVPVLAYKSSAIPFTLGEGGILFKTKDYLKTAILMNEILTDKLLQTKIINKQKEQLSKFNYLDIKNKIINACLN